MKNVKISFFMAINGEKHTEFTANGKISQNHLVFTDEENTVFHFEFSSLVVFLTKTGTSSVKFVFRKDAITSGTFSTMGLSTELNIKTNTLVLEDGFMQIDYELLDESTPISFYSMNLNWTPIVERKEKEPTWLN